MALKDLTVTDLVKNNSVYFEFFRQGHFYYTVKVGETGPSYQFPVPLEDIGTATLAHMDKAITFMRWIRKAKEEGTLILI